MTRTIAHDSTMIHEQWFYEPTYLHDGDDTNVTLFVRHLMFYRTRTGRMNRKIVRDVEQFANADLMVSAVKDRQMREIPEDCSDDQLWYVGNLESGEAV